MYGGVFKFLNEEKGLYFDSYYDLFLQNSTLSSIKSESQFNQKFLAMGSASLRVGWRWNTPVRSLFIDPLMLEVRGYTNTKFQEAGDPYSIFNMGPKNFILPNKTPNLCVFLFVTLIQFRATFLLQYCPNLGIIFIWRRFLMLLIFSPSLLFW